MNAIAFPAEDKPLVVLAPLPKALATAVLMLATMIVALDQTITTVAITQMQATLGATPDTISWVLTSYIMAGAVAMPLTGYLTGRFGRTRLFGVCVIIFTLSSMVCGMAVSLPMMVAARFVQGFSGAFLMPMSQSFLYDMNPPSQQVRAISIWASGAMIAPLLGPIVGSHITNLLSWRWVFFINLPIGIVTAIGYFAIMPKFPSQRRPFDGLGFILIVVALCSLQLALDRGTQEDWFESSEIVFELCVALGFFWMAFFHMRRSPHPIIAINLFANRNFAGAMVITFFMIGVVVSSVALMPALFVNLFGFPVVEAGMLMVPRGLAMMCSLFIGGRLLRYVDGRVLLFVGLSLVIFGLWRNTEYNLQMSIDRIIITGLIDGAGGGLVLTVIGYLAVSSAPIHQRTEASAIFTLVRNTGLSIAIAIFSALLVYNTQVNHEELGAVMGDKALRLSTLMGHVESGGQAAALANAEVTRQAMMIAYANDFWLMMWTLILLLPVVLLLTPVRVPRGTGAGASAVAE